MTHITVTVAIGGDVHPGPDLYDAVCAALGPFGENLDMATSLNLTADQIAHNADWPLPADTWLVKVDAHL